MYFVVCQPYFCFVSLFILCRDTSPVAHLQAMAPKTKRQQKVDLGDDEAATPGTHIAPGNAVIFSERAIHKVRRSKRLREEAMVAKIQRLQEEVETLASLKKQCQV